MNTHEQPIFNQTPYGAEVAVVDTKKGTELGQIWHLLEQQDHGLTVGERICL